MSKFGTAASIRVRVYFEGILVENAAASVTVTGGVNQPASAGIELVPTNTIKHIMPGTWVHVFTNDPLDQDADGSDNDFNLLFEGVVVGRGFQREGAGRSVSVQCMDASVFWMMAKQFWVNISSSNGEGFVDQMMIQTSGGYGRWGKLTKTEGYGYMTSKLAHIDDGEEDRFLDTLISVIDDIGNVNPFYTNARNRMRITDRIIRAPAGGTDKLFQMSLLSDYMQSLAGLSSGQTDLAVVINQILSAIVHEWASIPAPPYVKAEIFDRDVFGNIKRIRKKVKNRGPNEKSEVELRDFVKANDKIIASTIFKPHIYTLSPPTCNILFPNMYDRLIEDESFLDQPTRMSMRPQLPMVDKNIVSQMVMHRPTEVGIFLAQIRDEKTGGFKARTPDAKFGDGEGQAPNFSDYDWSTNEERIRGIVYDFINLAPSPSTLTSSDQGKKTSTGQRKGGIPKFLQNIASYEHLKAKFARRNVPPLRGPYNPRVVPGFSILILDDSEANMNMVAYLESVTHSIDADGSAMTSYSIKYPRMIDEVNYNEPKFDVGYVESGVNKGKAYSDLARDEEGNFVFGKLWENDAQPPIPAWFDYSFRTLSGLNARYQEWFGKQTGVAQLSSFKFKAPPALDKNAAEDAAKTVLVGLNVEGLYDEIALAEINEYNENISLSDAAKDLNAKFREARENRTEAEYVSRYTDRAFTKILEAFKFIGAEPKSSGSTEQFVGTTKPGYGFSAKTDIELEPPDVVSSADESSTTAPATPSSKPRASRMGAAFPEFDTTLHTGTAALDNSERTKVALEESFYSDSPRYDGRPIPYDFEHRIWLQSLANSRKGPAGEDFAEGADVSDYYFLDSKKGVVAVKTKEDQAEAAMKRTEEEAAKLAKERVSKAKGKNKKKPMTAKEQAPTGDDLDEEPRNPLPQPLSERQVIELRRAIIMAYAEELEKSRGFTG